MTRRDLLAQGDTDYSIGKKRASGELIDLGHGRYGDQFTPPTVVRALRSGVRLTCVSSLALDGFWRIPHQGLHVTKLRTGRHGSTESTRPGIVFHDPAPRRWPDDSALLPPLMALEHAARCLPPDEAAMVIDSGLRRRLLSELEVEALLSGLPQRLRSAIGEVRADADSGTETRVRRFFEKMRVPVRTQVEFLDGTWRVDLLVGERLVIECDSVAHHTGIEDYARTYQKRLELQALGLVVVNLTYEQVIYDWERTQKVLRAMIRKGVHRGPRR